MNKNYFLLFLFLTCFSFAWAQNPWVWQNPIPTANSMEELYFTDANHGWAVGYFGTILKSTDSGNSWALCTTDTEENLNDVFFINNSQGWASGYNGTLLHSSDGGENWASQSTNTTEPLFGVFFADANQGWT